MPLASTAFMAGVLTGSLTSGIVSDRYDLMLVYQFLVRFLTYVIFIYPRRARSASAWILFSLWMYVCLYVCMFVCMLAL